MTDRQQGLTISREMRGTAHWVIVTGPAAMASRASYRAAADARAWARELGKQRAHRVTSTGPSIVVQGRFGYAASYEFED